MEKIKKKSSSIILSLFLTLLLCFSMFMPVSLTNASAEETGESTPNTLETIIENTTFIAFRKSDITSKYKYSIFACYYMPKTFYDPNYEYGVLIFPKDYGETYGMTYDYHQKVEEQGLAVLDVVATSASLENEDGKIFKCGIAEMRESNLSREFTFVFYVKDTEGNCVYHTPQFAIYNTLDAKDFTDEELLEMVDRKLKMENSFKAILVKITELVNSIWTYIVLAMAGVVVVWGAYIGIRVVIAKRNEEKIDARGMLKSLIIGIIVMFTIAVAAPLLINGLSAWLIW